MVLPACKPAPRWAGPLLSAHLHDNELAVKGTNPRQVCRGGKHLPLRPLNVNLRVNGCNKESSY